MKEDANGFSVLSNPWDAFPSSCNITHSGSQPGTCSFPRVLGLRETPGLRAGFTPLECCLCPDFGPISLHYPFSGMKMYKSCPQWEDKSDYLIGHEAKAPGSGCSSLCNIDLAVAQGGSFFPGGHHPVHYKMLNNISNFYRPDASNKTPPHHTHTLSATTIKNCLQTPPSAP